MRCDTWFTARLIERHGFLLRLTKAVLSFLAKTSSAYVGHPCVICYRGICRQRGLDNVQNATLIEVTGF